MSTVTNYILTTSFSEGDVNEAIGEKFPAIDALNTALYSEHQILVSFKPVHELSGGRKAMEAAVFLYAANYQEERTVARLMRTVPWEQPDDVQLFVQEQEESRFREIDWRTTPCEDE